MIIRWCSFTLRLSVTITVPSLAGVWQPGTSFGIIPSTTTPFCASCDRSRLTADGMWYLCLYAKQGLDLRKPLRAGLSIPDIASLIRSVWQARTDRGAEERKALERFGARENLIDIEKLRQDPHLEMHARGG